MSDDPMFAPLPGNDSDRPRRRKVDAWTPITPVPADAAKPPAGHPTHGRPAMLFIYRDAAGEIPGYVARFNTADGKIFQPLTFCRNDDGKTSWRWKSWLEPRPLYGLDRLAARPDATVILAEGEKAADAASRLLPGFVAVTSPNGAKSVGKAAWGALSHRRVIIWPDADQPGMAYAEATARALSGVAAEAISVITPPSDVAEGWDAADAETEGWDTARALVLVEAAQPVGRQSSARTAPDGSALGNASEGGGEAGRKRSPPQRDNLVSLADGAELWHTPEGDSWATIPIDGHFEHWGIRSRAFRAWMAGRYFDATGGAPGRQSLEDALCVLDMKCQRGPKYRVFLRTGEADGAIFIDLADEQWRAVKITAYGWEVCDRPPVKFMRSRAMQSLPVPEGGAEIDELTCLLNCRSEADTRLVVAWLVAGDRPACSLRLRDFVTGRSAVARWCRRGAGSRQ